ncbi:hypothetical protein EI555_005262 [Monodon monoceros]|uniref:Nucleosome assembly protein 1-like 1 n=1 Tax=Monodon monoceros TaxID=40151 RepID=A0A4U1FGS1_MONMO|nr:hypothetical protein EI555_005262 [Monodon monoceros]
MDARVKEEERHAPDIDNKEQSELGQDLDDVEEVEETGEETKIKAQRPDGLVETPTGYIESLPRVVKRCVNALKNLQVKWAQIEAKFYEEVHDLERKFEIINAIYEPKEEEHEWKPDEEDEISEKLKEKAKIEDEKKDKEKEDPKGIPDFCDMAQEHDEPFLKHLKDIKVKFSDAGQPMSFVLEFHFEPNEPEMMGRTGCQTDRKKGKNDATLKTIKKQQKHKGRGTVRTVTKTVSIPESGDLDDAAEAILAADFEIGHFLREHIILKSVLDFTGEAIEDDDDNDDEEGEEVDEVMFTK